MNQISAYAFDVYGTLIDTNGVLDKLREYTEDQAEGISTVWRAKQLEYSFRRGLMQQYVPFPEITAQALDYALTAHKVNLSIANRQDMEGRFHFSISLFTKNRFLLIINKFSILRSFL